MNITMKWLTDNDACEEGLEWFEENFPDGADRNEVLKRLEEVNRTDHYNWLLKNTLKQDPLPHGWVLPAGLEGLHLGGGTLPHGTVLPEGLVCLYLGGGTLPEGTVLPGSLIGLHLGGGTLPAGTVLPEGLETLWLGGGTLPLGTEIPRGCTFYK